MIHYNIIIPVVYKDYAFLKKVIDYICRNLQPETIFIITKGSLSFLLPKQIRNHKKCRIIDEDSLLEGLSFDNLNSIIKGQCREHTNTGWFYQQFIKMAFSLSEYCTTEYYLSWDADTLPLKKISFFDSDGSPFFTMKTEFHKPYFVAIKNLFGYEKTTEGSFIAEHMMFNREVMREMLNTIESSLIEGNTWIEKIMNAIVPETVSAASFSEFETYGTYCEIVHPGLYKERSMRSFRLGGIIQGRFVSNRILTKLSEDVAVVSFEIYDRPPFPWWLICEFYERYRHYKETVLLKWQNHFVLK